MACLTLCLQPPAKTDACLYWLKTSWSPRAEPTSGKVTDLRKASVPFVTSHRGQFPKVPRQFSEQEKQKDDVFSLPGKSADRQPYGTFNVWETGRVGHVTKAQEVASSASS